ncbi:MAG TPA: hypothetical protein VHX11_09765 [Acidobacteriaceae bacterium]|nr:hypothetical protein [Acidobacteriaceae bacterium]
MRTKGVIRLPVTAAIQTTQAEAGRAAIGGISRVFIKDERIVELVIPRSNSAQVVQSAEKLRVLTLGSRQHWANKPPFSTAPILTFGAALPING